MDTLAVRDPALQHDSTSCKFTKIKYLDLVFPALFLHNCVSN